MEAGTTSIFLILFFKILDLFISHFNLETLEYTTLDFGIKPKGGDKISLI